MDLPLSVRMGNIGPMLAVARDNMDLTKYLVSEVMQSMEQRLEALRRFYPEAKAEDWRLEVAGQRVQIIKKDPKKGGVLQFGTELVSAQDGSLAALLGASPGASVTVSIMLELIERCFPSRPRVPGLPSSRKSSRPARRSWQPMLRCTARSAPTTTWRWNWLKQPGQALRLNRLKRKTPLGAFFCAWDCAGIAQARSHRRFFVASRGGRCR
jgi:hypothetical protein